MGKKDKKKGKGAEKTFVKTEKKITQKLKKELALKGEDDIESIVAKLSADEQKKLVIKETLVSPPSKRSAFSLTVHPDKDQLILFGGEYFNGSKTFLYNDLFFYDIKHDRWLQVSSPGGPAPRCSHQAVAVSQCGGQLWVFGGEFTSESQSQFHHYKDLWVFHFSSKKWDKVPGIGSGPSSRSGHRMVHVKKHLIIFGGFRDNSRDYKYFNDIYSFSLEDYTWTQLDVKGNGPAPRSACQMLPFSDGRILIYGGYSKEKVKKDVDKGVTYSDMYVLTPDKHDQTGTKFRWQCMKQSGILPSKRCAFSMALCPNDRALLFGGVDDQEEEEEIEGEFFNDLYQLDMAKGSWHLLNLTLKKEPVAKKTIDKNASSEDHLDEMDDLTIQDKITSDDGIFTVTVGPSSTSTRMSSNSDNGASCDEIFCPPPRINPGLVVKKGILYLYGGMYEEGDKQLTLNDFHYLDLSKLEEWHTIIVLKPEDLEWFDSESESEEESGDMSDGEEEDEEEEDEEMEC